MPLYTFETKQKIPASQEEVWDFISSPGNLKNITPGYMGFEVTSKDLPVKMYPGMIITYKVSPFLRIKMTWVTEKAQRVMVFCDQPLIHIYYATIKAINNCSK
jgi:ligand-binding SRPBCC domain-containing protein